MPSPLRKDVSGYLKTDIAQMAATQGLAGPVCAPSTRGLRVRKAAIRDQAWQGGEGPDLAAGAPCAPRLQAQIGRAAALPQVARRHGGQETGRAFDRALKAADIGRFVVPDWPERAHAPRFLEGND